MLSFIRVVVVMMSLHSNKNPRTETGTRDWDISVIDLTMPLPGGI